MSVDYCFDKAKGKRKEAMDFVVSVDGGLMRWSLG